jgi:hypothetical protein
MSQDNSTLESHKSYCWRVEGREHTAYSFDGGGVNGYSIGFPHQCDAWEISKRATKREALDDMRDFINMLRKEYARLKKESSDSWDAY